MRTGCPAVARQLQLGTASAGFPWQPKPLPSSPIGLLIQPVGLGRSRMRDSDAGAKVEHVWGEVQRRSGGSKETDEPADGGRAEIFITRGPI